MNRHKLKLVVVGAMLCTLCLHVSFALPAPFAFQGLGHLPGEGIFSNQAHGVSADGSVVAGGGLWLTSGSLSGVEAFRWTKGGGMSNLGFLPGTPGSWAWDISADGAVVVGVDNPASATPQAVLWSGGATQGLGDLPGGKFDSSANGVSSDGSVIVGFGNSAAGSEAFRWTSSGGMVGLGDLPGAAISSRASGVSADGSVVVGSSESASGTEAFRWTDGGGMVGLGDLPGGDFNSVANAVSADGLVIVGTSKSATGNEAFLWTNGGGMVGLGDLPGGDIASEAWGVSGDGSVIVGTSKSAQGDEAFLWTPSGGMQSLYDLLIARPGAPIGLLSWDLVSAYDVTPDGRTIVGSGSMLGHGEAWIATIPEPSTFVLAACGLAGLLAMRWRQRRRLAFV